MIQSLQQFISLLVSYKIKHFYHVIQQPYSLSLAKTVENLGLLRNLHVDVYRR